MIGFDGCCCDKDNCSTWKQDFSKQANGEPNPGKLTVISGDWSIVDGALQTTSDNAQINIAGGFTGNAGAFITVDNLAAGAEMKLWREAADIPIILTGGSPGQVAIPGVYNANGFLSDTEPANIPTSFRVQYARGRFKFAVSGIAGDGTGLWYNLGIYDTDHWRCLTSPPCDGGSARPLIGIGTGSLDGSTLRVSLMRCVTADCTESIVGEICSSCGLGMGPDNGGFYATLSGYSGSLAALNNTYYFSCATISSPYVVSVLGKRVAVYMSLNHIGVVNVQLLSDDPELGAVDWPLVRFNPPDGDPAGVVYWCRSWNSKAMTKVTNYTEYWDQLGANPADYASEAATITADGIWP